MPCSRSAASTGSPTASSPASACCRTTTGRARATMPSSPTGESCSTSALCPSRACDPPSGRRCCCMGLICRGSAGSRPPLTRRPTSRRRFRLSPVRSICCERRGWSSRSGTWNGTVTVSLAAHSALACLGCPHRLHLRADNGEEAKCLKKLENFSVFATQPTQHQSSLTGAHNLPGQEQATVERRVDELDQAQIEDQRPAPGKIGQGNVLDLPE